MPRHASNHLATAHVVDLLHQHALIGRIAGLSPRT